MRPSGREVRRAVTDWRKIIKNQLFALRFTLLLALVPLVFCSCESYPPCPPDGKVTAEAANAILSKSLGIGESLKSLNLTPATDSLSFTIFADQASYLRANVYPIMKASHRIAYCDQRLRTIQALLVGPGENKRSEFGTDLPTSDVPVVSLNIDCNDLRKFADDFDWLNYGLYVANRYTTQVNTTISDAWNNEVEQEKHLGHFQ